MADHGFKAKSIRKILNNKLNDWIKSVEDKQLQTLLKRDSIVTGGSIVSMLMADEIKDFDIYFKTQETTKAVAQYYCDKFMSLNTGTLVRPQVQTDPDGRVQIVVPSFGTLQAYGEENTPEVQYEDALGEGGADLIADLMLKADNAEEIQKERYRPIFLSGNAITLSHKIQLVIRFYGTPEEIHKNYDFEHCKNVYDLSTDRLYLNPKALESILSKTLLYTGSLYPICSLFRMRKFIERGWRISAGEILKMAWQVNDLDLTKIEVIREQLTGCDQAYMRILINAMEASRESNPEREIDSLYIVELVDKVFNT